MTDLPNKESLLEERKKHFLPTAYLYYKEPIHLVRAKGELVFDDKGREYLDAIGGIVCISAGHNHPRIKEALKEMLDQDEIQHTSLLYLSRHVVNLTKQLLRDAPEGLDRVAVTNSGSEADELAMMMARQKTGENTIVYLQHGYHGGTSGSLSVCGHNTWRFRSQPSFATTAAPAPYCYRCPFQKEPTSCALECAKQVETTIQTTTHGKIAAFIAEPIMGVGGFITPPDEYFDLVTDIVHKYGGAYISDEVQTGIGRCGGSFYLTKELEIDADFITPAKGLGNGAPVGAVLTKDEYADSLKGKLLFNTFGGDPYQALQAQMTAEIVQDEGLIENAQDVGGYLKSGLNDLMKRHPLIGDVRGRGLLVGFELVKDRKTKDYATEETTLLMEKCKDKGLLVGKGGLFGNVIRLAPPLTLTRSQADTILNTLDEAISEM